MSASGSTCTMLFTIFRHTLGKHRANNTSSRFTGMLPVGSFLRGASIPMKSCLILPSQSPKGATTFLFNSTRQRPQEASAPCLVVSRRKTLTWW